ncbi:hypothetical protein MtrunA17_Chr1g0190181 [Medicago truncatula]|uniref:Uncharacterized protein n=1 Tax=Medicago truncatula TaxID=3880 RepID=A0A396JWQ2_MEDTR|nr:hypothetical protein MtrunA17_Chr1g0190181 [Medicago truncatula]
MNLSFMKTEFWRQKRVSQNCFFSHPNSMKRAKRCFHKATHVLRRKKWCQTHT